MENSKFEILHISDLHIDGESISYFEQLIHFFANEFKGRGKSLIVIISGDLGDKCKECNLKEAKRLIGDMIKALGVKENNVIFCPGNHDIDTVQVELNHSDKCLNYYEGYSYLSNINYPMKAFDSYYNVATKNHSSGAIQMPRGDYFFELENARFFVLNSSKLSSIKKEKKEKIFRELTQIDSTIRKEEYVKGAFNGVLCSTNPNGIENFEERTVNSSFNYSENTRQQIDDELFYGVVNGQIKRDNKVNIIVLHHPEFCLHFLDRHSLEGIADSGSYSKFASMADVVICGHIHPEINFVNNDSHLVTPHLIGGKCNPKPSNTPYRPLFYLYQFDNKKAESSFVECQRIPYHVRKKNDSYKFFAGKIDEVILNPTFDSSIEKSLTNKIKNETEYDRVFKAFSICFLKCIEGYLKENELVVNQVTEKSAWFPNNTNPSPSYQVNTKVHIVNLENGFSIILDLIPSHLLSFPNYLTCRVENNRKAMETEYSFYVPIIVDCLYTSIADSRQRSYHKRKMTVLCDHFFNKERNRRLPLEVFLSTKFEINQQIDMPDLLKVEKLVFLDTNFVNSLLSHDEIAFDTILYDNKKLVLSCPSID